MSDLFEIEEPDDVREIENSHLINVRCVRCGAKALCASESAEKALCTDCHGQSVVLPAAGRSAGYTPVVRFGVTPHVAAPEERVLYPKPVVTSVQAPPPDMLVPASVIALHGLAAEYGWQWALTYSRGWMPHGSTGRPTAERHLLAVRIGGHPLNDRQAYAVYSKPVSGGTWAWSSVWCWGPKVPPCSMGITDLKEVHLMMPDSSDEVINTVHAELREIRANSEKLRKARAAERPKVNKIKEHG